MCPIWSTFQAHKHKAGPPVQLNPMCLVLKAEPLDSGHAHHRHSFWTEMLLRNVAEGVTMGMEDCKVDKLLTPQLSKVSQADTLKTLECQAAARISSFSEKERVTG